MRLVFLRYLNDYRLSPGLMYAVLNVSLYCSILFGKDNFNSNI